MMLKLNTVFFLISFSLLAATHFLALQLYLYWHYWWFDIPMHVIGGAVVALGMFTLHDLRIISKKYVTWFMVLLGVICTALVWEVYEVLIGIPIEDDYVFDTILDLVMGFIGGVIGYIVGSNLKKI